MTKRVILNATYNDVNMISMCLICFQFVFEGMEESGSEGLDEALEARRDTWLKVGQTYTVILL